ncbi:MAG: twin-arginine translocase TatA/TatE family subunit [bacterium]|nr:twin-arginine translocase TatA/TatE family subunit [bacterium]
MFGLSMWEIVVVVLAILLLFGGSAKLPEMARSLGKAFKEFKKAVKEVQSDVANDDDTKPANEPRSDNKPRPV